MEQSFPLLVNDMNMEIIRHMEDDALYNLCKTSRKSKLLCNSESVWDVNRPSKLAPLHFLRPLYKDWIDFYENTRNHYMYVVVIKGYRSLDYYSFNDMKSACRCILDNLRLKGSINQMLQDVSLYAKPNFSYEIVFVRKNKEYKAPNLYDNLLYQVNEENGTVYVPSFISWPTLNSKQNMICKKSRGLLQSEEEKIYYSDFTDDDLDFIERSGYNHITIMDNNKHRMIFERVDNTSIFKTRVIINSLPKFFFLLSDQFIDGSNKFLIATLSDKDGRFFDRRHNYLKTLLQEETIKVFREHGTFYKLQDAFPLIFNS